MRDKKFVLRIIAAAVFVILFFISCSKDKQEETIRLYARAGDEYAQGRLAETIEILHRVKKFPPALMLRAKAEYFSGDLEKAEKSCRQTLKYRPSSFEARLYLARILREKGDLYSAVRSVESLLADNPQDIRALRLASELAEENGKSDEAAILLDKAAELSAESAMVLLDRARIRWVAGRGIEALNDLSRAKAMLPWDTPLLRSIINLENRIKEAM
ncbi:MAG: tetratricopeptide repeat protein [Treponema sp.]|jgi:tetratricopeptide (TPR) repeat protein|nr:tetratricopeptide repeat protein [Treponema sp.]